MISKNELKSIKSLKVKKYRLREKRFMIEGAKNVLESVKSNYVIDVILATESFCRINHEALQDQNVTIVDESVLAEAGTFKSNNTCLAVLQTMDLNKVEIDSNRQIFALDGIRDPGNLGTIIRTLEWFGFDQLVCSSDSAELYNPKVVNSTMGSFTRMQIYYAELEDFLKVTTLTKYGADMNGLNLFEAKIDQPSIIVMGSESHGISSGVTSTLDHSINVPRYGNAESLNVAIATGVIASYLRMS